MIVSMVTLSALLLASSAFADDDASRAKLLGKWQQSDGNGEAKSTWNLESSGDSMRVSSSNGYKPWRTSSAIPWARNAPSKMPAGRLRCRCGSTDRNWLSWRPGELRL